MKWDKIKIQIENGEEVDAQAPVIVSASRSTDIPAFYSDWFFNRLKAGYIKWKNPFNGVPLYVSFKNTRLIVFWSKNPRPVMRHLDYLDDHNINYYFQYTLNDYAAEDLEKNVMDLDKRIDTFIDLSEKIGKDKVIWRFDPYLLTETLDVDELLKRTEYIGDQLQKYTNKMVFSFADIAEYRKVQNNLRRDSVKYVDFDQNKMNQLAGGLMRLNEKWNLEIGTCAEKIDLDSYGIVHNKCIDDDLMFRMFSDDIKLMDFIGVKQEQNLDMFASTVEFTSSRKLKDKGQRTDCGCVMSKDIGQYNTCPHECVYCYANTSIDLAKNNYKKHKRNSHRESIIAE